MTAAASRYAVVVVNWNGADDTLACLASLAPSLARAVPIVIDNASVDGSLQRIVAALEAAGLAPQRVVAGASRPDRSTLTATRSIVVASGENLGFAAGCNIGLRLAEAAGLDTVVFLNNDTIVEGAALDAIVDRLDSEPRRWACLPMLVVDGTGRIWNCGGTLWRVGLRRYHLAGRPREEGAARGEIACSFFTGCCFAVRTAEFAARGGFSERFFFGEEDFELAMWMKERGLVATCLTSAVVRHKVSASFDAAAGGVAAKKAFVYYLNRFIHMRLRLGDALWRCWVAAYLPYASTMLVSSGTVPATKLLRFVARLLARARAMERVTRDDFETVMREGVA